MGTQTRARRRLASGGRAWRRSATRSRRAKTTLGRWSEMDGSLHQGGKKNKKSPHGTNTSSVQSSCMVKELCEYSIWPLTNTFLGGSKNLKRPLADEVSSDLNDTNTQPYTHNPPLPANREGCSPLSLTKLLPTALCAIFISRGLVGISWQRHLRAPKARLLPFHLACHAVLSQILPLCLFLSLFLPLSFSLAGIV